MKLLQRILYWEAGVLALSGLAVAGFPKLVVVNLFGQAPYPEYAWIRIAGIQAVGFAMLAVLIGHRISELWWFCWAYVLVSAGIATVVVLNVVLGLPEGSSAPLWWLMAAGSVALAAALMWGIAAAGNEEPLA